MSRIAHKNRDAFFRTLKSEKIPSAIIEAFMVIPQEEFFDNVFARKLYSWAPLPIGYGEISDPPWALLRMLQWLSPHKTWRVLEVGTGSGYSTAVLSRCVGELVSIEINDKLAVSAKNNLNKLGITNVRLFNGDGTNYNQELGHFDAAIVLAACRKRPFSILRMIRRGGRLIFPMGNQDHQQITVLSNESQNSLDTEEQLFNTSFHDFCSFPPVRGKYGWDYDLTLAEDFSSEPAEG